MTSTSGANLLFEIDKQMSGMKPVASRFLGSSPALRTSSASWGQRALAARTPVPPRGCWDAEMSALREDQVCVKALRLLSDLCSAGEVRNELCSDFIFHLRDASRPSRSDPDVSVSLLSLVVTACGLALFGVSLFVSWKLCWVPWRERSLLHCTKQSQPEARQVHSDVEAGDHEYSEDCVKLASPGPDSVPESAMKISHTSPDIPMEGQSKTRENFVPHRRVQRQSTEPTSSVRHNSIRRQMNLSNPDFGVAQFQRQDSLSGLGSIKPELYKQRSVDSEDGEGSQQVDSCGQLYFMLKYDLDLEQLIVKIHKAMDLPAKDFSGSSDPYVKIYLLPDRKTKHQTKVHRKTLNPVFDEVFLFPVPYADLPSRKLHFSVYDFDRFSRHDIIGQVVVDNLLELPDILSETRLCKDIQYVKTDNVDLGDLMFSLCYLPTAGRLTITIIKARNLKAMDITGASDPYVKVSLICEGRRLKKRKTSTKRNTLNPVYNEAIVFDVPPENIDQISLLIAVMDYDRVGHNEVIGVCRVGSEADNLGHHHWNEMLTYPRKPIAHWHQLIEWAGQGTTGGSQGGSCSSLKIPPSP
ncbi:synaptotagmin-9-like isoform X1 [Arapaima gigas]